MKKNNVQLPVDAQYDYTDAWGVMHYHTATRNYVVDKNGYVVSYLPTECENI